jgi:hypothetical protein
MATVQIVFDRVEARYDEVELQSSEADVTTGLRHYNSVIDAIETEIASIPRLEQTTSTMATVSNTETTALPTRCLRVDSMDLLNATTSRPERPLNDERISGSPLMTGVNGWPGVSADGTGIVSSFSILGDSAYWSPLPSGARTVRVYGFFGAADATAATDTFPLPDSYLNPVASSILRLWKQRLDDPQEEVIAIVREEVGSVLRSRARMNRVGPRYAHYSMTHTH